MSHRRRRSRLVGLRNVSLTAGAVLGVLCLVTLAVCSVLGIRPLVVTSGSMSPSITTGSLVLARDTAATDVEIGDVVAVDLPDGGRVMHRVVQVVPAGDGSDQAVLTLKGDANGIPDSEPYLVRRVGEVRLHVPWLGYPITWLSTPLGLIGLGVAACGLLMFAFRRTSPPAGRRRAGALIAMPMTAILITGTFAPTHAYFTDSGTVASGTLTTYTVPKPVWVSCTVTGGALSQKTATIVWQEVSTPLPLDYVARVVSPNTPLTVTDNGTTRRTQFSAGVLSTVLNQTYNIEIRAALPAPNGLWQSVALIQPVTVTLLGLGMSCGTPR